jgi:hypothetical protein
MNLIENFNTGSFSRMIWLSQKAKDTWKDPLDKISALVHELEVDSVVAEHRLCAWQTIGEESVPESSARWAEHGLVSLPLKRVVSFGGFSHKHEEPRSGQPASVCLVVARTIKDCLDFKDAFINGDNYRQGVMLGFPKCCCKFFDESWSGGFFDPMWQAAQASPAIEENENLILVKSHPYSNPLLRYIGVRIGFHIPCSFNCGETIALSTERMNLARIKNKDLSMILDSLLQMPMEWSSLHGIGMVKTPIFYIVVQSVPTLERFVVRTDGTFIPKESCHG